MVRARERNGPKRKPGTSAPSEVAAGVYVGGWKEAISFQGARFCVLDEAPAGMPEATHLPIYDGVRDQADVRNLDRLADLARRARAKGQPVLFFCGHGVRRSPLAAAWYLHRTERIPLEQAYERIRAVRPRVESAGEWIGDVTNLRGD